jgi:hypothetical protein
LIIEDTLLFMIPHVALSVPGGLGHRSFDHVEVVFVSFAIVLLYQVLRAG